MTTPIKGYAFGRELCQTLGIPSDGVTALTIECRVNDAVRIKIETIHDASNNAALLEAVKVLRAQVMVDEPSDEDVERVRWQFRPTCRILKVTSGDIEIPIINGRCSPWYSDDVSCNNFATGGYEQSIAACYCCGLFNIPVESFAEIRCGELKVQTDRAGSFLALLGEVYRSDAAPLDIPKVYRCYFRSSGPPLNGDIVGPDGWVVQKDEGVSPELRKFVANAFGVSEDELAETSISYVAETTQAERERQRHDCAKMQESLTKKLQEKFPGVQVSFEEAIPTCECGAEASGTPHASYCPKATP